MAKSGIHIKPSKRGTLRSHLGVSKGKNIPVSKLAIKSTDSPAIRKKKQFAINARKWKKELGGYLDQQLDSPIIEETPIDNVNSLVEYQDGGSLAQLMADNPDLKNLKHYGQYTGANLATDLGLLAGGIGGTIGGIRGTPGGQERIAERKARRAGRLEPPSRVEPIEGLVSQPFDTRPVQLAPRNKQFGGILPTNAGYGIPMEFSDTQEKGYYPAYSDGGELLGYLPEYSFGSWLGDNAGKILKGAGGIVSVIPGIGQIAGPALIGAGAATDMIVGGVRKKRAEGEFGEAQERQRLGQELEQRKSTLESKLQPQTEYAATFGYQDGGALMEQPQQNQVPIINEYSGNANSHQEGVGGVPVDAQGNPSAVSKQSAVGLTENGEVTWNRYVFSDKIKI